MDPEKPSENSLKQIRTFEGDVAQAIQSQNESLVSIQRAEAAKRQGVAEAPVEKHGGRALLFALLTLVFAGLGGYGAYWAYATYGEKTALPVVEAPANQFISAANVSEVDASTLSRQALIGVAAIERSREREASSVTHIQLKRGTGTEATLLTTADFLTRLNAHAPQPLVRALGDTFMLGALGSDPAHIFIIVSIDSFQNAFPGLLEWEPRLAEDILPLFADGERLEEVPTSTLWRDLTVANRDARALRASGGETALIYAFFEDRLLIITDSEESLRTIAERLESQQLTR